LARRWAVVARRSGREFRALSAKKIRFCALDAGPWRIRLRETFSGRMVSDQKFSSGGPVMAKTKKVPKRIAGVKLPKNVRRGLRDLAADQNGRAVLIEALTAAGAALAAVQAQPVSTTRKVAAKQAPKAKAAAKQPDGQAADVHAAAVAAFEDAARSFTETLRKRGLVEPPSKPAATAAPTAATAATTPPPSASTTH
jgi:hypothetical protein